MQTSKTCLLPFILMIVGLNISNAQSNLAQNYDFESYNNCNVVLGPEGGARLNIYPNLLPSWRHKINGGSPDYFHSCMGDAVRDLLSEASPKSGNGMIGFIPNFLKDFGKEWEGTGEYIIGTLKKPLVANKRYYVEFNVKFRDNFTTATDGISLYLTSDTSFVPSNCAFQRCGFVLNSSQMQTVVSNPSGNVITDKKNWTKISGEITAKGGEVFAVIGYFKSTPPKLNKLIQTPFADKYYSTYYFIDNVRIWDTELGVCPNNLLTNGGFETPKQVSSAMNFPDNWTSIGRNCFYGQVSSQYPTGSNLVKYPYSQSNGNEQWLEICSHLGTYSPNENQAFTSKLKAPLRIGNKYLMSFYSSTNNVIPFGRGKISIKFSTTPYGSWDKNIGGNPVFNDFEIQGETNKWHYHEVEFIANNSYEYTVIQAKDGHHLAIDEVCIVDMNEIEPPKTVNLNAGGRHGDFNGDVKIDLLYFGAESTVVALNDGQKFGFDNWQTAKRGIFDFWTVGDFNGDGKDDILNAYENVGVMVFLSNGKTFLVGSKWTGYGVAAEQFWTVGDFNGDGKDDLLRTEAGVGVHVLTSTGTVFQNPVKWTGAGFGTEGFWSVGDFNGDGKDDILRNEPGKGVQVLVSNGNSFASPVTWSGSAYGQIEKSWRVGDFNNDGKDDILRTTFKAGDDDIEVLLSTGTSFRNPQKWIKIDITPAAVLAGDFNGDKFYDILYFDKTTKMVCLSNGVKFSNPIKWQ